MSASLLTLLIIIILIQSVMLFLVYQLWQFRLTNLQNQIKMQVELFEALDLVHMEIHELLHENNSILKDKKDIIKTIKTKKQ